MSENEKENLQKRSGYLLIGAYLQSFPPGASCSSNKEQMSGHDRLQPCPSTGAGVHCKNTTFTALAQRDSQDVMSESPCTDCSFASAFTQAFSEEAQCISNPS